MGLREDELWELRDKVAWSFTYTGLVTDLMELQLIILTIIYTCVQQRRTKALGLRRQGTSISICLQLLLMFIQSLLYSAEKFYMVLTGDIYNYRRSLPSPIYNCQLLALHVFMMQHALYVGQYARIAVSIPLIFVQQTDQVQL